MLPQVFIQKAAVNLLSSVLDTPEFFWRAPDSFQALYERICEYLELEARVEVLNARFAVRQLDLKFTVLVFLLSVQQFLGVARCLLTEIIHFCINK